VETAEFHDAAGRALNPRGRTGIAGRGLLGGWGSNAMVGAIVVRTGGTAGECDILLGRIGEGGDLSLPKGFVASGENRETAMARVLEGKIGWRPEPGTGDVVFEGYNYDARQTDHAWIEIQARLFYLGDNSGLGDGSGPNRFRPGNNFEEIEWWRLDARTVNRLPSNQACLVREAVKRLRETEGIEKSLAVSLLAKTG
jgi:ADP-ribose pyrophosphatase